MDFIAITLGGFFGAVARYSIGQAIPAEEGSFPLATFLINLIGCLFLGWFFTKTNTKWHVPSYVRTGIGTGFTGAFTTFSTFSVETVRLMQAGKIMIAATYVLLSVVLGIGLSLAGARLAAFPVKEGMR